MKKPLTEDIHFHLYEYQDKFNKLRSAKEYPGSIALINDYEKLKEGDGDSFFEKYGVGNNILNTDRPFERVRAYESLLNLLHLYDKDQYLKIHKGTPYFFIGWTAFQFFNFEKAFFYMDAAVSEDIRRLKFLNLPLETEMPGFDFLLLNPNSKSIGVFLNTQLQSVISDVIKEFNKESGLNLKQEDLVKSFIKPLLFDKDKKHRSIITAFYTFILEADGYSLYIDLRSSEGGSIDPLLSHLFSGARILESLLGLKSNKPDLYNKIVDLKTPLNISQKHLYGRKTLTDALSTLNSLKKSGEKFQNYNFAASYIIRNTTGHSLIWTDEFQNAESYMTLYRSLVNSILWTIYKLWIL